MQEEELHDEDCVPGQVVFARVRSFPWWPAIVGRAPNTDVWKDQTNAKQPNQAKLWVFFFNDNQGAWLKQSTMKPYTPFNQEDLIRENEKNPKYGKFRAKISQAVVLANEFLKGEQQPTTQLHRFNTQLTPNAIQLVDSEHNQIQDNHDDDMPNGISNNHHHDNHDHEHDEDDDDDDGHASQDEILSPTINNSHSHRSRNEHDGHQYNEQFDEEMVDVEQEEQEEDAEDEQQHPSEEDDEEMSDVDENSPRSQRANEDENDEDEVLDDDNSNPDDPESGEDDVPLGDDHEDNDVDEDEVKATSVTTAITEKVPMEDEDDEDAVAVSGDEKEAASEDEVTRARARASVSPSASASGSMEDATAATVAVTAATAATPNEIEDDDEDRVEPSTPSTRKRQSTPKTSAEDWDGKTPRRDHITANGTKETEESEQPKGSSPNTSKHQLSPVSTKDHPASTTTAAVAATPAPTATTSMEITTGYGRSKRKRVKSTKLNDFVDPSSVRSRGPSKRASKTSPSIAATAAAAAAASVDEEVAAVTGTTTTPTATAAAANATDTDTIDKKTWLKLPLTPSGVEAVQRANEEARRRKDEKVARHIQLQSTPKRMTRSQMRPERSPTSPSAAAAAPSPSSGKAKAASKLKLIVPKSALKKSAVAAVNRRQAALARGGGGGGGGVVKRKSGRGRSAAQAQAPVSVFSKVQPATRTTPPRRARAAAAEAVAATAAAGRRQRATNSSQVNNNGTTATGRPRRGYAARTEPDARRNTTGNRSTTTTAAAGGSLKRSSARLRATSDVVANAMSPRKRPRTGAVGGGASSSAGVGNDVIHHRAALRLPRIPVPDGATTDTDDETDKAVRQELWARRVGAPAGALPAPLGTVNDLAQRVQSLEKHVHRLNERAEAESKPPSCAAPTQAMARVKVATELMHVAVLELANECNFNAADTAKAIAQLWPTDDENPFAMQNRAPVRAMTSSLIWDAQARGLARRNAVDAVSATNTNIITNTQPDIGPASSSASARASKLPNNQSK